MQDEAEKMNDGSPMLNRRRFLQLGLLTATAAAVFPLLASARTNVFPERTLDFYNIHTGEYLRAAYWTEGNYDTGVLNQFNVLMRDYRTGEIKTIDPRLLDLLHSVHHALKSSQPFHIISGYRSAETNAMLAERTDGVAKHSYHIKGMAIDVFLPGRPLRDLRRAALALNQGGVGYYPESEFVHLDVGPVRRW